MNVDRILSALNEAQVDYLLIGGMNFMLRHRPVLTFDVDIWIRDDIDNRDRCMRALALLGAEWGPSESEWRPVSQLPPDWLARQPVYALTTRQGALDIFRTLAGVPDWNTANARAITGATADGTVFRGLCDRDMLACQEALPEHERKAGRVAVLRDLVGKGIGP